MGVKQLADEAILKLNERMATHVDSRCATEDEVYMAAMTCEIQRLREIVKEINLWVVCSAISTPEDMAQNFPRVSEITEPDFSA